jgi:hypothetical protein
VIFRSSTPFLAHDAQTRLDKVDGDDGESAKLVEFDDCFRRLAFDRVTADDELDLSRFTVALARGDLAGEDDGFEIEDREVVIVKFFRLEANIHDLTRRELIENGSNFRH